MTNETETPEVNTDEAPKTDNRYKMVTHPVSGEKVKRVEYIRELWTLEDAGARMTRAQIAKHLSEITGETVVYQIVFAATKGIDGGPAPVAKEEKAADATEATEATASDDDAVEEAPLFG